MADNVQLNSPTTAGAIIATDDIVGVQHQKVKVEFGDDGFATQVSETNPMPVGDAAVLAKLPSDPATQTTLASILAKIIAAPSTEAKQDAAIALLTTIAAITQPLTDAQLRATPVPISGTVNANTGLVQALTDAQLRATPVPISGAGDATAANQVAQSALLTAISSLIETNNTLVQRLEQLGSAMNAGAPALRVVVLTGSTTAVTGSLTSAGTVTTVGSITNFGTGVPAKEMADDMNNLIVTMANINNVTA